MARLTALAALLLSACVAEVQDPVAPDSGVDSTPSPDAPDWASEACPLWDDPEALEAWADATLPEGLCVSLRCPGPLGPCESETCGLAVCSHAAEPDAGLTAWVEAWVEGPLPD